MGVAQMAHFNSPIDPEIQFDDSLSDLMVRMPRLNSQASEKIITFFGAEKAQPSTSFVAENNDIRQCIFN